MAKKLKWNTFSDLHISVSICPRHSFELACSSIYFVQLNTAYPCFTCTAWAIECKRLSVFTVSYYTISMGYNLQCIMGQMFSLTFSYSILYGVCNVGCLFHVYKFPCAQMLWIICVCVSVAHSKQLVSS